MLSCVKEKKIKVFPWHGNGGCAACGGQQYIVVGDREGREDN